MNFKDLGEWLAAGKDRVSVFGTAHKFDLGSWRDLPAEMVDFGARLLTDGIFRLPFPVCVFGGDHDLIENQVVWPGGYEAVLDDPAAAEFPWVFRRPGIVGQGDSFTRAIAVEAIDLGEFGDVRDLVRRSWRDDGDEMEADFILTVYVDFGRDRGWEKAGVVVADQRGEIRWNRISDFFAVRETERVQKLSDFFAFVAGQFAVNCVLGSVAALASRSTRQEIVPAPGKLNRARAKKGKPPIYEYRRITIGHSADMPKTIGGKPVEGRASPRLHWRRGHYRTLPAGVRVPVAPALVGLAENGFLDKDYVVQASRRLSGDARQEETFC